MTKGQFAALTAALGLATMAGTGFIAYASSSSSSNSSAHGADAGSGASADATTAPYGGATMMLPTAGASASLGAGAQKGAGATASAGAAASGGTAGAAASDAPACGGNDIQVSTADDQGAAGHISFVLVFINTSTHACVLSGYPGAELVGQNDADLLDAQRTLSGYSGGAVGLSGPPKVLLPANGTASAVLEWSDVPTGSGLNGGCTAPNPISLVVTPPNTKQSTTISLQEKTEVCAGFEVHPVLGGVTRSP